MRFRRMCVRQLMGAAIALSVAICASAQAPAAADPDPVTTDPGVRDSAFPPDIEELAFQSAGARVNALMYVAQGAGPHPTVVLLHGFPGNERNLDLAQAIRRAGINVLFFSYRGLWGSGGTFSFPNALDDVAAALRYLRTPDTAKAYRVDAHRIALVGHSLGAWAALMGAAADPAVQCVAGIEVANMGAYGRQMRTDTKWRDVFQGYFVSLAAPGGPMHAEAVPLITALETNADTWDVALKAPALSGRAVLLLDNTHNEGHAGLVRALGDAGAHRLTELVWDTDHSFSDRRIALAHSVVGWLRSNCGY
jgi:pimeloyl-ACP methyl ester carboxylesterase